MKTVTVGDLLDGKPNELGGYDLYIIRDGSTVFYVGQSRNDAAQRVIGHLLGDYGSGPSSVGKLVIANWPSSRTWQVELLHSPDVTEVGCGECQSSVRDRAERLLIGRYNPVLNATYNRNPTSLPDVYKEGTPLDLDITVSDFIPLE